MKALNYIIYIAGCIHLAHMILYLIFGEEKVLRAAGIAGKATRAILLKIF